VWCSHDSGGSWESFLQVEPDELGKLHTAYSALAQLNDTHALVVWERGPLGSHCTPAYPNCFTPAGEYQTLRSRVFALPSRWLRQAPLKVDDDAAAASPPSRWRKPPLGYR